MVGDRERLAAERQRRLQHPQAAGADVDLRGEGAGDGEFVAGEADRLAELIAGGGIRQGGAPEEQEQDHQAGPAEAEEGRVVGDHGALPCGLVGSGCAGPGCGIAWTGGTATAQATSRPDSGTMVIGSSGRSRNHLLQRAGPSTGVARTVSGLRGARVQATAGPTPAATPDQLRACAVRRGVAQRGAAGAENRCAKARMPRPRGKDASSRRIGRALARPWRSAVASPLAAQRCQCATLSAASSS